MKPNRGILNSCVGWIFIALSLASQAENLTLFSPNTQPYGRFGQSVAGVPDTNGDGRGEVVVGAWLEDSEGGPLNTGRAYLYDGATGALLHTFSAGPLAEDTLLGFSVSGIPDANGDGRGDVAVGAYGYTATGGPQEVGAVYIFDGSSGLLIHSLHSLHPTYGGEYGISVSGSPDLTGDGFGDVIVGAPHESPSEDLPHAGRIYVYDGFSGELVREILSPEIDSIGNFGHSVSSVPDADGDGLADILVGAYLEEGDSQPRDSGHAYLFNGQTGELIHSFDSPNPGQYGYFGVAVTGVEDLNGDGFGDVAIGADHESPAFHFGRVYVFDGRQGSLLHTLTTPDPEFDGEFGHAISGIPDMNGDGRGDLIIGAHNEQLRESPKEAGRAYIFDGSSGALIEIILSPNEQQGGQFGISVTGVPDTDGDGLGDVLVGAIDEDLGPLEDAGMAYLFRSPFNSPNIALSADLLDFGKTNIDARPGHVKSLVIRNEGEGTLTFADVGLRFDFENESEFVIAASDTSPLPAGSTREIALEFTPRFLGERRSLLLVLTNNPSQRVFEVSLYGIGSDENHHVIFSPLQEKDGLFGFAVQGIEDLNGDARGDLVVGAPGEDEARGNVYVFDANSENLLLTLHSPTPRKRGHFGASIRTVSDQNGDGLQDILVGAYGEDVGSVTEAGRVYLFDGVRGTLLSSFVSPVPETGGGFGFAMEELPLGEGSSSIFLISATGETQQPGHKHSGRVYLFDPQNQTAHAVIESPTPEWGEGFGGALSQVPDTNGDGQPDLLIGAHRMKGRLSTENSGRAFLYDGSTYQLRSVFRSTGFNWNDRFFGVSVLGVSDLNEDGMGDLLIGAKLEGINTGYFTNQAGKVYVFDGSSGAQLKTVLPLNPSVSGGFGNSLASMGDLNRDGYP
ncbi:MAG: FG-GAP repeat protein, partial [Candidatus Omnitrophica bacterium]|nr:FG-GAP repeat protein [Candidatus Omnitrophota bacterium]